MTSHSDTKARFERYMQDLGFRRNVSRYEIMLTEREQALFFMLFEILENLERIESHGRHKPF